jgi:hypothetical protein
MAKFILQLDSPLPQSLRSFQIVPSNQFGFDFVGSASPALVADGYNPDVSNCILCMGKDRSSHELFSISLYPPNITGKNPASLVVGMQGSGEFDDATAVDWTAQTGDITSDTLLWKVVSISGQPPPSWRSMDIFQDLPEPSDNSAVA